MGAAPEVTGLPAAGGADAGEFAVANALLALLEESGDAARSYLTVHLASHLTEADAWDLLSNPAGGIDLLDPASVSREVYRTGSLRSVPGVVLSVAVGWSDLATCRPGDRRLVRHLWQRRLGLEVPEYGRVMSWSALRRVVPHRVLSGHTRAVTGVCPVTLPDGTTLIATTSDDKTVRLWNPATETQLSEALTGDHVFAAHGRLAVCTGAIIAAVDLGSFSASSATSVRVTSR